jgi:hypothetical protein
MFTFAHVYGSYIVLPGPHVHLDYMYCYYMYV